MPVTAIEGIVENGRIRLREDIALAENTRVFVIVADVPSNQFVQVHSPRLAHLEQAADFRKKVVEIPGDAQL